MNTSQLTIAKGQKAKSQGKQRKRKKSDDEESTIQLIPTKVNSQK